jgi:hypothetical protein
MIEVLKIISSSTVLVFIASFCGSLTGMYVYKYFEGRDGGKKPNNPLIRRTRRRR